AHHNTLNTREIILKLVAAIMFDIDKWNEIYATLSKNKLRTFLTAFGVFWGIFMLIIMLGSGNGLRNGITRMFSGSASNAFYMWAQSTSMPYKGLPRNRSFTFKNEDVEAIRKSVPEADIIAPSNQLGGYRGDNNVVRGNKVGPFSVRGDYPETREINSFRILSGRFINYNDMRENRKVCAIGEQVQAIMFDKEEDPIGQHLQVNGVYFKVVGVISVDKAGEDAQERMQTVYVPFSTFQQAFNWGNNIGWFAITSKPDVPASVTEDKVRAVLLARHRIHPEDKRAVGSWNTEKEFGKLMGLFSGIEILVWIVGTGTLLAGVIGVSNIMLIVVKERTREIGIRRAIGATPFSVMSQIMMESVILTSLAGYLGLVCGIFLMEGINTAIKGADVSMFQNPGVDINIALKALLILISGGALAGIIPARKAVSVSPVEALRAD
ncbi:MAG: ABC transporter permease, partial [Bacteroidota bacterium]